MAARRINEPIEPMTLGNMRANGVRSLDVSCWRCHHRAILSADPWSDDVPVPTFGVFEMRDCRRRRATALAGADAARKPERRPMGVRPRKVWRGAELNRVADEPDPWITPRTRPRCANCGLRR
jgi:hypothetical protein